MQEIFGVHEHIKDVCRWTTLGYYAIAPELYARQGDPATADIKTIVSAIVPKLPDAQVMADLDAALAFAKASGSAETRRFGAIGFCWGGRIYGRKDDNIPASLLAQMENVLQQAGSPSTIHVYPEAPHGFFADYRASYDKGRRHGCLGAGQSLVPGARRRLSAAVSSPAGTAGRCPRPAPEGSR